MNPDGLHAIDIFAGLVLSGVFVAAFGIIAWAVGQLFAQISGRSLLDPRQRRGGRKG